MLFDQPAWAERLQQMGVGQRLDPKRLEAPTTARLEAPTTALFEARMTARLEAPMTARLEAPMTARLEAPMTARMEACGAVGYLVGQLRYVSMSSLIASDCL